MAIRRRKKRRMGLALLAIMVFCICLVVGYQRMQLEAEQESKDLVMQNLTEQIKEERERTGTLEQQKAFTQTKLFIEEAARQYLGLVYPDEIILKPEE